MSETKRALRAFLYHAPGDKEAVRDLYLRLIQDGVDAWLVKDKLLPSQDWKHELEGAMREADVVIVCLSEHFHQGGFQKKEMRTAFDAVIEQLQGEVFVVPVYLEECEQLALPGAQPRVDLFAEAGYETLLQALQIRAGTMDRTMQRKADAPPSSLSTEDAPAEQNSVAVRQGTHGILIDGLDVDLQASPSRGRLRRVMSAGLVGMIGLLLVAVLGAASPRFERWYKVSLMLLQEQPVAGASAQVRTKLSPKAPPVNIVFLIDTTASMQGKIGNVKSALADFISRLDDRYPVSILTFNSRIELETGLTTNHGEAGDALGFIGATAPHDGVCLNDALYSAIQETRRTPLAGDARSIVILLTDIDMYGDSEGWDCHFHFSQDVIEAVSEQPVSIFDVHIDNRVKGKSYLAVLTGGASFEAKGEKGIGQALRLIADKKLGLKTQSKIPAPLPANSSGVVPGPMVLVPAGEFTMGSHPVTLDAFWIDKTEVTNVMYGRCVRTGVCGAPHSNASNTHEGYYGNGFFDDYPVIYVSWLDANAYCSWAGERLPTEAEWEKAARGTDGRQFPWGGTDPAYSNFRFLNYNSQDVTSVGLYPDGASPYGALDMAGNVGEWVADWFSIDYYNHPPASNPTGPDSGQYRVWRGGSWANTTTEWIQTYSRTGNLPTDYSAGLGFRCARDAAP